MASREQRLAIVVVAKDMASATLKNINAQLGRMGQGSIAGGIGKLTTGLIRVGVVGAAAAAGGIIAAAKAGIDFEDAWSGVKKTVEGTPEQLDALYASLRQLAMRIPVKFTDLALIAQEAGALGVAVQDVDAFTEAVARTSAATVGLTTEAASEAFGKLGSLFDLHGQDFEKLGSVLVDLGNNAASTEGDIVAVGLRFGGVGRAAGLSIPQILAWSSTIASLGPLAEAGGSSLGRLFTRVIQYAGNGDKKLEQFAKAAGMTTDAFRELVRVDTNTAFLKFITGLKGLDKLDLGATLHEAGINNVRDIQSIQAFLLRTDLLTDSLQRADSQWQTHNALLEVSDKRFDNLKSHVTEFKNAIIDAAVTVSEGMNPAIDRAIKKLRAFLLLPETQGDLKALGKDIGEAIDKINWTQVLSGAKTLVGLMKTVLDYIRMIPPEITAGIVGFGVVNRVSGGMISGGASDVLGGLLKQFVGRGSSPGNALWVRDASGPGGIGGKGGGVIGGLGKVLAVGAAVGSIVGVIETWRSENDKNTQIGNDIAERQTEWLKSQPNKADLENGLAGVEQGIRDITSNPLYTLVQGEALDKLRAMESQLELQLYALDTINTSIHGINLLDLPGVRNFLNREHQDGPTSGGSSGTNYYDAHRGPRGPGYKKPKGFASGGFVRGGEPYIVGEYRPEVFVPEQSGRIMPFVPNGGTTVVVNLPPSRFSAREAHRGDRSWRRVTSANGNPVSIY